MGPRSWQSDPAAVFFKDLDMGPGRDESGGGFFFWKKKIFFFWKKKVFFFQRKKIFFF